MEESDDFKLAVKVVIKRQMKDLMEQLRERGEEIAVLTVDLEDNSYSHFGSPNGEWFLSQQKNIPQSFLSFCQSNTNQASQTTVTAVSPKKKSIASLRSASKQNTSTEVPEVRVTVPKKLAGDLSEEEVAVLVGRIVATHLAFQEKGDGSSSGTQFDVLLKTANQSKHKGNSSIFATPRSARKRKPTAKFMEGMSSLKKSRKIDDEETNEMEVGNEEMFGLLSELSNNVLRRVKVTVPNNKTINLEKSSLDTSETTEALAVYIIQELDAVCGSQLANRNSIKLTVNIDEYGTDLIIEHETMKSTNKSKMSSSKRKVGHAESLVKSESEVYLDEDIVEYDGDDDDDYMNNITYDDDDDDDGDSDMEEDLPENFSEPENGSKKVAKKRAKLNKGKSVKSSSNKVYKKKPQLSLKEPYACNICGIVVTGYHNLDRHIRRIHDGEKTRKCMICPKAFFSTYDLEDHMLGVHSRKCETCGVYVHESMPWTEGMSTKSIRMVDCKCGQSVMFADRRGRKKNLEMFPCEICGKLFKQKYHLRRHVVRHGSKKCEYCHEVFKYKGALNKHIAVSHRDMLQLECKHCFQCFDTQEGFKEHLKSHQVEVSDEIMNVKTEETAKVVVVSSPLPVRNAPDPVAVSATDHTETYQIVNDVLQGFHFTGEETIIIKKLT